MVRGMHKVLGALLLVAVLTGCADPEPAADDAADDQEPSGPRRLEIAQTYEMAGGPEWLIEAFGSVWVHKDDGYVVGFDPVSGDEAQTLDTGYHVVPACQGVGADEAAL